MMIGAPWSLVRFFVYLTVLSSLVWKYRANRVISFGVITLGCAALAFVLGLTPGAPDWLTGVAVAIFLLMAVAMIPVICLYVVRYLRKKPQTPGEDLLDSNHPGGKTSKLT
jgi:amino acid transporter